MTRRWQQVRRSFDPALPELRRRTAWLLTRLDPKARSFVRLLPLLLAATFRRPSLDREAPGLKLMPRRRRWGTLCAELELPPPSGFTSARPLVASVLLAPLGDGRFEVLVLPVDAVPSTERHRLVSRMSALSSLAQRHCPSLEVRLASRAELTSSLIPWAAVCAGELPPFSSGPVDRLEVVARAPTPLARCLALLVGEEAAPPLEVLRADPGPAHPEAFAARWGGSPIAVASVTCARQSLAELVITASRLREACIWALRHLPPRERRPLRALLRRELFSASIPSVLRPALESRLLGCSAVERAERGGWALLVDGVTLARAETLDQLRADAVAESPRLTRGGTAWGRVAQLLASPGAPRSLVVVESGSVQHLVVSFTPSGRPRARRVGVAELLRFAMHSRLRGAPCEVLASIGSDPSVVTRVAQLSTLVHRESAAIGLQVGDRLLLADGRRIRSPLLGAALSRPRRLTWLPEDPELLRSLSRMPSPGPLPMVHAIAFPLGDTRAALYSQDTTGAILREEVPLATLEAHLIEARELLRRAAPPSILSVAVHPTLATLAGRRLDAELPSVPLDVDCEWPFTIRTWLDGEAFCAPGDLSWTALAEAILSHWPPGTWGRVGVRHVNFIRPPPTSSPLVTLAVRARVLRRLATALRRLTRVLEAA